MCDSRVPRDNLRARRSVVAHTGRKSAFARDPRQRLAQTLATLCPSAPSPPLRPPPLSAHLEPRRSAARPCCLWSEGGAGEARGSAATYVQDQHGQV
eukprot:250502-Chlamydomonas_euryale.AAC.31